MPHFELVFYLTMEALGRVHQLHRNYNQWLQMEEKERELHRGDMADVYIAVAERFEHSAIFVHPNPGTFEECARLIPRIREKMGDRYFLMKHGDETLGIPDGSQMFEFSYRLADEPGKVKAEAAQRVEEALEKAARQKRLGEMDVSPHVLHSLDPLAGVDIAEVKRLYGDRVCLIGNVNCGLMDSDTEDEVVESARYALRQGMPGGGYIFSTSNCIYTGMPLSSYERMLEVRRVEGNYPGTGKD